jgi:hypothetical protein
VLCIKFVLRKAASKKGDFCDDIIRASPICSRDVARDLKILQLGTGLPVSSLLVFEFRAPNLHLRRRGSLQRSRS